MSSTVVVPSVGDWVELVKSRSGSNVLVKGSRWQIEAIAPDRNDPNRKVCRVNNGRLGNNQVDFLYLDEIEPSTRWKKGDVIQSVEDPRLIGEIVKAGELIKVRWSGIPDDQSVSQDSIILFVQTVGKKEQILGEYAFKKGDRVTVSDDHFKGEIFTVRECLLSGMVAVTDSDGFDKNFAGSWLSVISHQSSDISNNPPVPGDFRSFKAFNEAYEQWLDSLDPDDDGDDIVLFEENWTSAKEIWEDTHLDRLADWVKENYPDQKFEEHEFISLVVSNFPDLDLDDAEAIARQYYQENLTPPVEVEILPTCENFTTSESWINPRLIDTEAGTQTRLQENSSQISLYAEKMTDGGWDWQREPLPELVQEGDKYYIVSGHHRVKAALQAGVEGIYCRVTPGTLEDAKLLAIRSNSNDYHGVPESRADFRNRVEKFLNLLETWDTETQIRELELLKSQPYASEQVVAIDQLLNRIRQGGIQEEWSSRIIACYVQSPRAYRTIATLINARQSEARFRSVLEGLSEGDWVQFLSNGQERRGKVHNLSELTVTVEVEGRGFVICLNSPIEILETLIKLSGAKPEPSPPPIPQRKKKPSISRELKDQSRSLGLPESEEQALPDTSEADHDRNTSDYDVDDRPFAPNAITDYAIAFKTNVKFMTSDIVADSLESICEWLNQHEKLDLMQVLMDVATEIRGIE